MTEDDILYESGKHWVCMSANGRAYQVFRTGLTHSVLVATIGKSLGLQRAIDEAERREAKEKAEG